MNRLWVLFILLLSLVSTSWGTCVSLEYGTQSPWGGTVFRCGCPGTTDASRCPQRPIFNGKVYFDIRAELTSRCMSRCDGQCGGEWCDWQSCYYWAYCDTQVEVDSAECVMNPGHAWSNGACIVPVCETNCSSHKLACTGIWKDSVTYTVDAGTGDTTFTCIGYCRTAKMTYIDSTEAMDDSLSIIFRKNYADSVKIGYGENCVSSADTTGASGTPSYVGMTYFIDFNNVESELDTAGVSFVKGLYNYSCERILYRGIRNGRYVFWYSPDDIPTGVTNVVRIK